LAKLWHFLFVFVVRGFLHGDDVMMTAIRTSASPIGLNDHEMTSISFYCDDWGIGVLVGGLVFKRLYLTDETTHFLGLERHRSCPLRFHLW